MARAITASIAIIIAGGVFFFYTQPAYDTVQSSQAKINQYNTALDKAAELQTLKQSLLSRYNAFDPNSLDRLQKLLPDHVDNIALILELDSIATRYGLALQNVDISSGGAGGQSATNQTAVGAIGGASRSYDSITLRFSTTGTYTNFLQFLTDLENSLRIVDLSSLAISRTVVASGAVNRSSEPLYGYTITLKTYWLK